MSASTAEMVDAFRRSRRYIDSVLPFQAKRFDFATHSSDSPRAGSGRKASRDGHSSGSASSVGTLFAISAGTRKLCERQSLTGPGRLDDGPQTGLKPRLGVAREIKEPIDDYSSRYERFRQL